MNALLFLRSRLLYGSALPAVLDRLPALFSLRSAPLPACARVALLMRVKKQSLRADSNHQTAWKPLVFLVSLLVRSRGRFVATVESDQRSLAGTALPNCPYGFPVGSSNSAFGRATRTCPVRAESRENKRSIPELVAAHEETPSSGLPLSLPPQLSRSPSLVPGFPGRHGYYRTARLLTAPRVGFSASALYRPYSPGQDRTLPA